MKRLLHIIATPRGAESRTLKVSAVFLQSLKKRYPACVIDELKLFDVKLPELTVKAIDGKYLLLGGKDLDPGTESAWKGIVECIERFMRADAYLVSTPMWNFGIPYILKQYIDIIVQPRHLFRYTEKGPEGLVTGRKMVIITSRGGDYSQLSPFHPYDFQEPYLKAVFGFVGIKDITFVNAEPMDAAGPQVQSDKIAVAQGLARQAADNF